MPHCNGEKSRSSARRTWNCALRARSLRVGCSARAFFEPGISNSRSLPRNYVTFPSRHNRRVVIAANPFTVREFYSRLFRNRAEATGRNKDVDSQIIFRRSAAVESSFSSSSSLSFSLFLIEERSNRKKLR